MPVKYRIDKRVGIVHAEAHGALIDAEVLSYQHDLRVDPDFDPSYREFFDFSGATLFWITPLDVRALASSSPWGDDARRAFVAPDDHAYGMLRMFQCLLEIGDQQVAVFRTAWEAWRWLEQAEGRDSFGAKPGGTRLDRRPGGEALERESRKRRK